MKFQKRGFASLLMTLSFLVATASGVVLYLSPRGRTANWTDWSLLGMDKQQWAAVHINTCLLLLIVAAVHLSLNWAVFFSYIQKTLGKDLRLKQETFLAVLFTLLVTAGAYLDVPPFSMVTASRYRIMSYWDNEAAAEVESVPATDGADRQANRGRGRGPRWSRD